MEGGMGGAFTVLIFSMKLKGSRRRHGRRNGRWHGRRNGSASRWSSRKHSGKVALSFHLPSPTGSMSQPKHNCCSMTVSHAITCEIGLMFHDQLHWITSLALITSACILVVGAFSTISSSGLISAANPDGSVFFKPSTDPAQQREFASFLLHLIGAPSQLFPSIY